MKPSKILLDTNILLDSILQRDEFVVDARKIIRYCVSVADGYVAAHSLTNIFYVLSQTEKRPLEDFEDSLQYACAEDVDVTLLSRGISKIFRQKKFLF